MRTKLVIVVSALSVVLGACTGNRQAEPPPAAKGLPDVLVLDTGQGPMVLDTGSGSVLAQDPGALASPDGSRLYSTSTEGNTTTLRTVDGLSGRMLSTTSLQGTLEVRAVSVSGRAAAMMPELAPGRDPWVPVPRSRTTIEVADPSGRTQQRTFRLAGNYEPEAFSVDDRRLFLIQYLPAEAPTAYRVTFLDLDSGDVRPVFGRFNAPPERMPGIRLRQVFDPVTSQLYTLYSTDPSQTLKGYWEEGYDAGRELTFVHVLSLRQGWAYCAGLPRGLWGQPAGAQAMVTSPDGGGLYIVDAVRGLISRMDTRTLKVTQTQHVPLNELGSARTSASISADGSTLFVSSAADDALYAIDTDTLQVAHRWPMSGAITDLALSGDGTRLYAAMPDQLAVIDVLSGAELSTLSVQGVDAILNVETPTP